ncbi:hypothetical protein LCGC14_1612380, partial [marine sediment metagenome]
MKHGWHITNGEERTGITNGGASVIETWEGKTSGSISDDPPLGEERTGIDPHVPVDWERFDVLPSYADMFLPGAFESDDNVPVGDDDEAENLGGTNDGIEFDWDLFGEVIGGGESGGNWG